MCERCIEAVREVFPAVPDADMMTLLWAATCYPFGAPEDVRQQLVAMRDAGINTMDEACAYAETAMDKAMGETRG